MCASLNFQINRSPSQWYVPFSLLDAASRIKSTDLINFRLRVVNLDDERRIDGDRCVIFNESKFLLSFCKDKMAENWTLLWPGIRMISDTGQTSPNKRHTHTHIHREKGERLIVQETLGCLFLLRNLKSNFSVLLHCGRRWFCILKRWGWCCSVVFATKTNSVSLSY